MLRILWVALLSLLLLAVVGSAVQADPFVAKARLVSKDAASDMGGFGNIEGRFVKPLSPATLDVGGGIGLQWFTMPKWVPIFSQRKIFSDFLLSSLSDDKGFIAIATSLKASDDDDGLRLGVEAIGPNPWHVWYIGKAFNFTW